MLLCTRFSLSRYRTSLYTGQLLTSLSTSSKPSRHLILSGTRLVSNSSIENSKVEHSQFLANASSNSQWKNDSIPGNGTTDAEEDELEGIGQDVGQSIVVCTQTAQSDYESSGKILPTTSHLFKLILPLGLEGKKDGSPIPTVILLHPSQPLSHVSRLILASLPRQSAGGSPSISFRSNPSSAQYARQFEWSDSTDIGDFIRDAARSAKFNIHIKPESQNNGEEKVISVRVPTFADRTRFIRKQVSQSW